MNKPFHHNDCYKYLQQYFFRMCWYRKWVRVPLEANRISNEVFSFENNNILKSSNLELSLEYTQRHNFVTLCVYIVYFKSFAREKWTCQNQQKNQSAPGCLRREVLMCRAEKEMKAISPRADASLPAHQRAALRPFEFAYK